MKICKKCKIEKPVTEFSPEPIVKSGLRASCKECVSKQRADYRNKNASRLKQANKEWRSQSGEYIKNYLATNRENTRIQSRKRYQTRQEVRDKTKAISKARYARLVSTPEGKQYVLKRQNALLAKYRKTRPEFRTVCNLRSRMQSVLKAQGARKIKKSLELIGCGPKELRAHLESLWTEGMSWDNYSYTGWHIDHIKPCCEFDLTDPEQQKQCFHYTNLQPLWAKDNLDKRTKFR